MDLATLFEIPEVEVAGELFSSIDAAADRVERGLNDATRDGLQRVQTQLLLSLNGIYSAIRAEHGRRWPTGGPPWGTNPTTLSRRSGRGLESIQRSIRVGHDAPFTLVEGRISTGTMTVHETGATVRPKRSKYLTIPFMTALDSQGLPLRRRARDWDNTFIARTRRGNLIIFRKENNGRVVPLYLLAKKSVIRPRLGMQEKIDRAVPYFQERALDALAAAYDGAL